jgi:dTDP-4-dehydrorhamnose reductase
VVGDLRVLVTGGSGLLGAEIVRQLLQTGGDEVFAGYNEHTPRAGNPVRLDFARIHDISPMIQKVRPNVIFHTAAVTDVDLCEKKPELANLVNGEATKKIAEAAGKLGSRVAYVSTDYVFDGKTGSYREEDAPHPVNVYGESKLLGEMTLKESGTEHCIVRTSVVYGWGRKHRSNFATWVLKQLQSKQPVRVLKDHFASPTLNQNLASMLIETAMKSLEGTIHLAGATRIDRYNFALQIAQAFGLDQSLLQAVQPDSISWVANRPQDSSLNVNKASRLLDRKPLKLDQALAHFKAGQEK